MTVVHRSDILLLESNFVGGVTTMNNIMLRDRPRKQKVVFFGLVVLFASSFFAEAYFGIELRINSRVWTALNLILACILMGYAYLCESVQKERSLDRIFRGLP